MSEKENTVVNGSKRTDATEDRSPAIGGVASSPHLKETMQRTRRLPLSSSKERATTSPTLEKKRSAPENGSSLENKDRTKTPRFAHSGAENDEEDERNANIFIEVLHQELKEAEGENGDEHKDTNGGGATNTPIHKAAREIISSVRLDMENIIKTVKAAEVDIITRINTATSNRKKKQSSRAKHAAADAQAEIEVDPMYGCNESMPPLSSSKAQPPFDDEQRRELIIRAARETALMQETSRRLRKLARELSQRRIPSKNVVAAASTQVN